MPSNVTYITSRTFQYSFATSKPILGVPFRCLVNFLATHLWLLKDCATMLCLKLLIDCVYSLQNSEVESKYAKRGKRSRKLAWSMVDVVQIFIVGCRYVVGVSCISTCICSVLDLE